MGFPAKDFALSSKNTYGIFEVKDVLDTKQRDDEYNRILQIFGSPQA